MAAKVKLGLGLVGLSATSGWLARAHLPAIRAGEDFEVRALVASSPASGRAAANTHGVPAAYETVEEMAAAREIDAIVVGVKVPDHRAPVSAALSAGKPVLCEWPLGVDLQEAELLAELAAASGGATAIGLQGRSAPHFRWLAAKLEEGLIGEVLSTSIIASAGNWGATFRPGTEYQLDPANGANLVTIPFAHTLDTLTMVLGPVRELTATTATRRPFVREAGSGRQLPMNVPDQLAAGGRLQDDAVLSIHFRGGTDGGLGFHWEIHGTDGVVRIDMDWGHPQFGRPEIALVRDNGAEPEPLLPPPAPDLPLDVDSPAYNIACAYRAFREDLDDGGHRLPDFDHAVALHRTLDRLLGDGNVGHGPAPC